MKFKPHLFLVMITFCFAQHSDLIQEIHDEYRQINNFEAKVKILTDVPNFRMPVKTITLYYLKPDSVRIKSRGFTLFPKTGPLPFLYLNRMVADSIQADTTFEEFVDGKSFTYISISDSSLVKTGKLVLTIDNYLERIERVNLIENSDTLSTFDFTYQNIAGFWMPETTTFSFNLEKRLPKTTSPSITNPFGSIDIGSAEDHFNKSARIQMIFFNMKVNEGF